MIENQVLIIGGIIVDKYVLIDKYPKQGQDGFIKESFNKIGGCSINVAYTLKNLGIRSSVVSAIGDDSKGQMINNYLETNEFDTQNIRTIPNKLSGYCITLLDETGERTFLTYKGCEDFFEIDMVNETQIKRTNYVYLTGYYLVNRDYHKDIIELMDKIVISGGKIIFDPGPLIEYVDSNMILDVLKRTYILTPNKVELNILKNSANTSMDFKKWTFENGVSFIIEKLGSEGTNIWSQNSNFYVPAYKVNVTDTTGAGDSFAGGLIYAHINNFEILEAVKFASACGAFTTTFTGPHGTFDINDIKQLIEKGEI